MAFADGANEGGVPASPAVASPTRRRPRPDDISGVGESKGEGEDEGEGEGDAAALSDLGDVDDARAAAAALDDPDDPDDARAALGDLGARFAAAALGDADGVVAIAHTGGIAPLITQVREGAPDTQEQAADALWKLA